MTRNTQAAQVISRALVSLGHPTARQLYDHIHTEHPHISLSTVFRRLGEWAVQGTVLRLSIPGADDIFDATMSPHSHIRCSLCGRVDDLPAPDTASQTEAAAGMGYTVNYSELSFLGICADCKK